jgi:PqqD family protein of HPr-rel-A system
LARQTPPQDVLRLALVPLTTLLTIPSVKGAADVWRLPAGASLLWQSWDEDEVIVFNPASGQTHLLDAFSAVVLRRIEAAPTAMPELQRSLAADLGLEESVLSDRLREVCRLFDQLGLAEADQP